MEYVCIAPDVKLGKDVKLAKFINLYGCEVGDETKIGAFVEIQKNARIGRRCKISSHTFICEGVTIEDHVFIGHGVMFINDSYPRATTATGDLQTADDWKVEPTVVKKGASIGSGATILVERDDRRTRHRRRRQRRHARRSRRTPSSPAIPPGSCVHSATQQERHDEQRAVSAPTLTASVSIEPSRSPPGQRGGHGSRWRDWLRLLGTEHRQKPAARIDRLRGRLGLRQEPDGAEARAERRIPACS